MNKTLEDFRNKRLGKYGKAILEMDEKYPDMDPIEQLALLSDRDFETLFTEEKRQLIELYAREELTQKELDDFLERTDIETMNSEVALIFAYLMKKFPELEFGSCNGPRLKGIIKYYRFHNLERISHFSKIIKKLNEKEIIPMVIKGGAMKILRPDLPRLMGDIDILFIDGEQFRLSKSMIEDMGYLLNDCFHSVDIYLKGTEKKNILDIHRRLSFLDSDDYNPVLFKRASLRNVYGGQCYVPAYEDLAFIIILNISRNLSQDSSLDGIPFAVIDLLYLSSRDGFDWNPVLESVKENRLEGAFFLAWRFIEHIVPGLIPSEKILNQEFEDRVRQYAVNEKRYIRKILNSAIGTRIAYCRRKIKNIPFVSNSRLIIETYRLFSEKKKRAVRKFLSD